LKSRGRYFLFRLEEVRSLENPEARVKAREEALKMKRSAALKEYVKELKRKYTKVNRKLFDRLDYEVPGSGYEALLQDKRVVATVKGDTPVKVSELTDAIQKKFFHGPEKARKGRINRRKQEVLDELLIQKASIQEAKRLKLDRSDFYRKMLQENRKEVLFGTFVVKVIDPEIKVEDEEIKAYQQEHPDEYTTAWRSRIGMTLRMPSRN
jgi:hypothetical protein